MSNNQRNPSPLLLVLFVVLIVGGALIAALFVFGARRQASTTFIVSPAPAPVALTDAGFQLARDWCKEVSKDKEKYLAQHYPYGFVVFTPISTANKKLHLLFWQGDNIKQYVQVRPEWGPAPLPLEHFGDSASVPLSFFTISVRNLTGESRKFEVIEIPAFAPELKEGAPQPTTYSQWVQEKEFPLCVECINTDTPTFVLGFRQLEGEQETTPAEDEP